MFSFPKAPVGAFVALFHVELKGQEGPAIWGDLEERPRCVFCNSDSWVVVTERDHARVACRVCDARGPSRGLRRSFFPSATRRALLDALSSWLRRPDVPPVEAHDLRACPHCATVGGLQSRTVGEEDDRVAILCDSCGAQGPTTRAFRLGEFDDSFDPRYLAEAIWNERAGDYPQPEHDDELEDEMED